MLALTRLRPTLVCCRAFASITNKEGAAEAFPLKSVFQHEMMRKAPWYEDELKEWKEGQDRAKEYVDSLQPKFILEEEWEPFSEERLEMISTI